MFFVYYSAQGADMNEKTTAMLSKIKMAMDGVMHAALWILIGLALLLDAILVTFWLMPPR